jgi:nucleoside-diphosphate-sugar epimerase
MQLPRRDLEEVASRLAERWEEFRGTRIFVTGATGFVGRWLVETFSHASSLYGLRSRIFALSRDPESFLANASHFAGDPQLTWVKGDLDDPELFGSGVLPESCDFVVHTASPSSRELSSGEPERIADTIEGTRHMLDFAVRAGARRFLYLSSGAVNGRPPDSLLRISEDFLGTFEPRDPAYAYAETKLQSEVLCLQFAKRYGIGTVIARGFSFIGPYLPLGDKFAAGSFLGDSLRGEPIRIRGDGTPLRSYLYAGDMAAWLWTILIRGISGRAYNVGSERAISIAELAREAASLADQPLAVEIAGSPDSSNSPDRYVPSTERARSELGLAETVDWRESLRRTYEWNRAWFSNAKMQLTR